MSTEQLDKNQKFIHDIIQFYENNGNSAGYLASLEAAKTSNAAELPEIATNQPPNGTIKVQIRAVLGHYIIDLFVITPRLYPQTTGHGVGGPEVGEDYEFETEYMFLGGATLHDLLERKKTILTWYTSGDETVAIVSGLDGKNLLHLMKCPIKVKSGGTVPVDWRLEPMP